MAEKRPPTRSSLMAVKQELRFSQLGYELLDQKKSILINELIMMIDRATELEDSVERGLAKAYAALKKGILETGRFQVGTLSGAISIDSQIGITQRKVMGVSLPIVELSFSDKLPYFSPYGTTFHIDDCITNFKESLKLCGQLAELKVSIMRLAKEAKKCVRKVNALDKIAIPTLNEELATITSRLEENEREGFVLMRSVKKKLESEEPY